MPPRKSKPRKTRVRCLGIEPKEHWFWSDDRVRHRKCPKCEAKEKAMRLGKAADCKVYVLMGDGKRLEY